MLTLALAAALVLLQEPPPAPDPPLDPKEIARTVDALRAAFAGEESAPKLAAVRRAEDVPDAKVAAALAKGLKEERAVQEATLAALRWMDHPSAWKALHAAYEREERLVEDDELLAQLLKAIGQHGVPESIEVLADRPFQRAHAPAVEARILGLGMIRDPRSVAELFALMQRAGQAQLGAHMDELRLALVALTGVDRGESAAAWIAWWNDHKKDLVVPADMPRMAEAMQRRWELYWGLEYRYGRAQRREDRGGAGG